MFYRLAAEFALIIHFIFVLFVIFGAFLCFRWKKLIFLHFTCLLWSLLLLVFSWRCPLTPLEVWLRRQTGQQGYTASFIEYYIVSLLYPAGLRPLHQLLLAIALLLFNGVLYGFLIRSFLKFNSQH